MSAEAMMVLYGALAAGVLAFPAGVVASMLVRRYLPGPRKVRCVISEWEPMRIGPPNWVICSLEVDLFNERPSSTELSGVCAEFLLDGERRAVSRLRRPASSQEFSVLNLPPQQWTHSRLYTSFKGEEGLILAGFRQAGPWQVDFVGYLPDGEKLRQKIVERKNFFMSYHKKPFFWKGYAHPSQGSQVMSTTPGSSVIRQEENRFFGLLILTSIGGITLLAAGYTLLPVLFGG
jgi:hypothetical protein